MLSQVTFTTQNELKKQALSKAKQEGLSLKTVLVYALKGFVTGTLSFGLSTVDTEPEIEEIHFRDPSINAKAKKLAELLQ
ncbi:MAG: hypothetical protein A2538_04490 [Candidatus Magasanikbacteria bacterium RIFOXYD2_FULL_41_14]|uniref:Uncharacterized protein n=1 Tax=Candidatus Magasanikbacteria bacterium RIFOXYD2_FULL_41_14 TaxID=1798709 RepID=A0A1F6PF33_9BACT|nr:MAG: hypothetical protein A2538_04490 [Candidatus Magasanikbacteria bacterium RIFOXYD2_FULL_41_14]